MPTSPILEEINREWRDGRLFIVTRAINTPHSGASFTDKHVMKALASRPGMANQFYYSYLEGGSEWRVSKEELITEVWPHIVWIPEVTPELLAEFRPNRWFMFTHPRRGRRDYEFFKGEMLQVLDGVNIARRETNASRMDIGNFVTYIPIIDWSCGWNLGKLFKFHTVPSLWTGRHIPTIGVHYKVGAGLTFVCPKTGRVFTFEEKDLRIMIRSLEWIRSSKEEFEFGRKFKLVTELDTHQIGVDEGERGEIVETRGNEVKVIWGEDANEFDWLSTELQEELLPVIIFDNTLPGWGVVGSKFSITKRDPRGFFSQGSKWEVVSSRPLEGMVSIRVEGGGSLRDISFLSIDSDIILWRKLSNRIRFTDLNLDLQNLIRQSPTSPFVRGFLRVVMGVAPSVADTPTTTDDWIAYIERTIPIVFGDPLGSGRPERVLPTVETGRTTTTAQPVEETRLLRVELSQVMDGYQFWRRVDHLEGDIAVPISILRRGAEAILSYIRQTPYRDTLHEIEGEPVWGDSEVTDLGDLSLSYSNLEEVIRD